MYSEKTNYTLVQEVRLKHSILQPDGCAACGKKKLIKVYLFSEYCIYKCSNCGTGVASPMPDENIIKNYYNGFLPSLNREEVLKKAPLAKQFFERNKIAPSSNYKFLDLGGGTGLFSYAFEHYSFGTSTYVDRDPKSCEFVKNELKINKVLMGDVNNLFHILGQDRYDVIYSRHLIEHLVDPFGTIEKSIQILQPNGIAIHQCPNGNSLEYLIYKNSNLWDRFNKIRQSTRLSRTRLFWQFLNGEILHGIDPPRHLWAITPKGMTLWAKRNDYHVEVFTTHIGDLPFSPEFKNQKSTGFRFAKLVGQKILAPIRGGTHLINLFKKQQ